MGKTLLPVISVKPTLWARDVLGLRGLGIDNLSFDLGARLSNPNVSGPRLWLRAGGFRVARCAIVVDLLTGWVRRTIVDTCLQVGLCGGTARDVPDVGSVVAIELVDFAVGAV